MKDQYLILFFKNNGYYFCLELFINTKLEIGIELGIDIFIETN